MRNREDLGKEVCVDQIFAMEIMVEEYLRKAEKLYTAFMNLEKTFDIELIWKLSGTI